MFIYLFIVYIKDLLKFLFIYNIAVIIPFSYSAYNITNKWEFEKIFNIHNK